MARAQKVDISTITDIKKTGSSKEQPAWWAEFRQELEGVKPGGAIEFTPEGEETSRQIRMRVATVARSMGMKIKNDTTDRNTVVTQVQEGQWEPKPKRDPSAPA